MTESSSIADADCLKRRGMHRRSAGWAPRHLRAVALGYPFGSREDHRRPADIDRQRRQCQTLRARVALPGGRGNLSREWRISGKSCRYLRGLAGRRQSRAASDRQNRKDRSHSAGYPLVPKDSLTQEGSGWRAGSGRTWALSDEGYKPCLRRIAELTSSASSSSSS